MTLDELCEAIDTMRNSIIGQIAATKTASDPLGAEQRTMLKAYLDELVKRTDDVGLRAVHQDFSSGLTVGGANTILGQMLRLCPEYKPGIMESTPDDLDL